MSETPSCNPLEPTIDHTLPSGVTPIVPQALGYVLYERVGVGGMGEVYRCDDDALGRDLAIKVIKPQLHGDADAEERFLREARLTGSLQHPGIVPIHQFGRLADGRTYYTMKLIRGRTFADMIREEPRGPERLPHLLAVVEKVCQAVAYAHSRGVIHRDLKPANVMVGEFGEVQVMDWGLAKELARTEEAIPTLSVVPAEAMDTVARAEEAEGLSRAGAALGTPNYMSPEQAAGDWDIVDERADVFALGAILCQVLIGRPPYYGASREDILRRARLGDLAEAIELLRQCGADAVLVQVVRDCLAARRENRPRHAGVVAERLSAYETAVQERLRQAELERVAAEVRAREEQGRAAAERRAKRRLLGLAAAVLIFVLMGAAGLAIGMILLRAEQQHTQQALNQVTAEQQKTQAAWKQTREALNTLTDEVVQELLGKQAALGEKEKAFLRKALGFYERFAAERGEDEEARAVAAEGQLRVARLRAFLGENVDAVAGYRVAVFLYEKLAAEYPAVTLYRLKLAVSHNNLGNLLRELGRRTEAEAAHRQALKLQEKLAAEHPAMPHYRKDLATSHNNLGNVLLDRGRFVEAEAAYRQALKLRDKLAAEQPAVPLYRQDLATSHNSLGNLLRDRGRFVEAEAAFRQALKLRERLAAEQPTVLQYRLDLAGGYNNLGNLLADLARRAEAETAYRQALKLQEKLAAEHASVPQYRLDLAGSYVNFGNLLREQGQTMAALDWYPKAFPLLQTLLAKDARLATARIYLRNAHWGRAQALAQLGRPAEAAKDWQQAAELDDGGMRPFLRLQQSFAAACAGDHRAAGKVVEELLAPSARGANAPRSGVLLYDAARVYALSATVVKDDAKLREPYAARAIALLRQAHQAGFFKDPKWIDKMRKETDLNALRQRDDFKQFLAELP